MSEMEQYKRYMNRVHAPESACTEVKNMISERAFRKPIYAKRRVLLLAAAAALFLALSLTAYAKGPTIFGWGGNFEVQTEEDGRSYRLLHTDSLIDPVRLEDGKMIFIVNDEEIDITDRVTETQPFLYDYTDDEGITHFWIVGMNGPEPEYFGYGEYLRGPEGNWLGGYSARTNLDNDGKGPAWLQEGKRQLNIPW